MSHRKRQRQRKLMLRAARSVRRFTRNVARQRLVTAQWQQHRQQRAQ